MAPVDEVKRTGTVTRLSGYQVNGGMRKKGKESLVAGQKGKTTLELEGGTHQQVLWESGVSFSHSHTQHKKFRHALKTHPPLNFHLVI